MANEASSARSKVGRNPKRPPSAPRRGPAKRLLGHEAPRLFTPPLRELTPATSKGFAAIEFAEEILELTLHPWQKWVLIHALELKRDGTFRFRTVLLLVARQNGKSTLLLVLALYRMYVDGAPLVIGTAQNLDISEELWAQAVEVAQGIPELDELIEHVDKTNGKKALRLVTGERYKVAAASRRGGRGLSGDLVLLDELREHKTWDAWGAVTKTTMARLLAQVWAASNAGDLASIVLRHLRSLAHRMLGWPDGKDGMVDLDEVEESDDDSLFIAEYSAKPGRGIWDREGWAEANPSMNRPNGISEIAIAGAAATDPEAVFRTEVLCQQVAQMIEGPIPIAVWEACGIPSAKPVNPTVAAWLRTGVEQSLSVVAAYETWVVKDGERRRVDVLDLGFYEWTLDATWPDGWAASQVDATLRSLGLSPGDEIAINEKGDGNKLLSIELQALGWKVHRVTAADAIAADVGIVDAAKNERLAHINDQDDLTVAVIGARTVATEQGDRFSQSKSDVDTSPLRTAALAWWRLQQRRSLDYDIDDSIG